MKEGKKREKNEEIKYGVNNREFVGHKGHNGHIGHISSLLKNTRPRLVGVNEAGQVIGESHPGAVLSDHEVGLVLELREAGLSFGVIATKMEVSKSCIARICWGHRRAQYVVGWKRARG